MSETVSSIASALQPFVDRGDIAGAVALVGTKDKILSLDAVGYADIAGKIPMRPNNIFWIASMTKPITGTALMMVADEGLVNVDDPVEKYLPEYKGQMVVVHRDEETVLLRKPKHPILVREVLNHTSGLPFCTAIETPTLDRLLLEHAVRSYAMTPLDFEPGTKYSYSNAGTNTAGRIIEVVTGMTYEKFMDERLFGPLGMKDTTFWPNDEQAARLAKIYLLTEGATSLKEGKLDQLETPFQSRKRHPMPAGGLFSTATDCLEFCRMVLNGGEHKGRRYLCAATVKAMTSKQTSDSVEARYGFGWGVEDKSFGHGGAYKTNMTIFPESGLITIFLVHHNGGPWPTVDGVNVYSRFMEVAAKLPAGR